VVVLAVVAIVGAGIAIWWQMRSDASAESGTYFTIDDGQTLFVAPSTKLAPFDKNGKPAYRAHVFECGGKRVVGYLSRYTAESIKALEEAKSYAGTGKAPPNARQLASIATNGIEIKKPGDTQWTAQGDPVRAARIRVFRCPDGSTPNEVYP